MFKFFGSRTRQFPNRILFPASRSLSQFDVAKKHNVPLDLHPEVQRAIETAKPIVALETALVTHGFPYPENLTVAMSLENIVRSTGAIPATIGIIGGRVKIGLTQEELERLACRGATPTKVSRRDIAPVLTAGVDGGTTCSATMIFAALAGIKVFSTGGLGGVHRDGQNSMDISADLNELSRCPVGVVSSGVKSILDIGRTLEHLETLGVPVLTYGPSREFPAFFSKHSGFQVPWNVADPESAAKLLYAQWQLGLTNGALFAVPIPDKFEAAGLSIQKAVDQAVSESQMNGVSKLGKEATPWLLARVSELTRGKSRASNIGLLENTALVGGKIAVEYQKLVPTPSPELPVYLPSVKETEHVLSRVALLIAGSSAIDITARAANEHKFSLVSHSTIPGSVSLAVGGVARNVAEAFHRAVTANSLQLSSILISPVGDDEFGRLLIEETKQLGMRADGIIKGTGRTAVCNMFLNGGGGLIGGIADMDITRTLDGKTVISHIDAHKPRIVALDGNLSPEAISDIVKHCTRRGINVFFEPASVTKAAVILPAITELTDISYPKAPIAFCSPNMLELAELLSRADAAGLTSRHSWWQAIDSMQLGSQFRSDLKQLGSLYVLDDEPSKGILAPLVEQGIVTTAIKLLPFFQHLFVKCGEYGVFVLARVTGDECITSWEDEGGRFLRRRIIARGKTDAVVLQHFPPHPLDKVVNVTGAGDSFVGVLLVSLLQCPDIFQNYTKLGNAIKIAQKAASLSLQSHHAVSPLLSEVLCNSIVSVAQH